MEIKQLTKNKGGSSDTCLFFTSSDYSYCKYRIVKQIGCGTFSTVYLCEDTRDGKQYAMKVHQEYSGLEVHKRAVILNDAQVISKLQGHPNVIQVKEVHMNGKISNEDGTQNKEVFAVMVLETLKGGELYYHIRKCEKFSIKTSRLFF